MGMKISKNVKVVFNFPTWFHLGFSWNVGFVLFMFLILQILTGIIMGMFYDPSLKGALSSIIYVIKEVKWGFVIHHMHGVGASFIFAMLYFHMGKAFFYGLGVNSSVWLSGFVIFLLLVVEGFLGYSIVLGSMSYWAIKVVVSMFSVMGGEMSEVLMQVLLGGDFITDLTVRRFYVFHCIIPFVVVFFVFVHMAFLHKGGSNMLISCNEAFKFYPYMFYKDVLLFLVVFYVYITCVLLFPNFFYNPVNFEIFNPNVTPEHIEPEWYLRPFFIILKGFYSKGLGIMVLIFIFVGLGLNTFSNNRIWKVSGVEAYFYFSFMIIGCFISYWLILGDAVVSWFHWFSALLVIVCLVGEGGVVFMEMGLYGVS
uniref:cytochrome b n=1 Tax=Sphaeromyxa zaharoni TaxID=275449 RepID=UPI003002E1E7